jgi:hypothetical protein
LCAYLCVGVGIRSDERRKAAESLIHGQLICIGVDTHRKAQIAVPHHLHRHARRNTSLMNVPSKRSTRTGVSLERGSPRSATPESSLGSRRHCCPGKSFPRPVRPRRRNGLVCSQVRCFPNSGMRKIDWMMLPWLEILLNMEKDVQQKYRLYRRRNGRFYWQENNSQRQGALRTSDRNAMNESQCAVGLS